MSDDKDEKVKTLEGRVSRRASWEWAQPHWLRLSRGRSFSNSEEVFYA